MAITSLSALRIGLLLAVLLGALAAGQPPPISNALAGGQFTYAAQKGDSLTSVGARFGMDVPALAELNGLEPTARLKLGQVLRIDPRNGADVVFHIRHGYVRCVGIAQNNHADRVSDMNKRNTRFVQQFGHWIIIGRKRGNFLTASLHGADGLDGDFGRIHLEAKWMRSRTPKLECAGGGLKAHRIPLS